jgi:1-acyl-sn-glycerol-3-phosphate acyltransferase
MTCWRPASRSSFFRREREGRSGFPLLSSRAFTILAQRFPDVELIPVYLDNVHRSMPKGTFFPVPLICTVRFGAPLPRIADEDKSAFLERARNAVIELAK